MYHILDVIENIAFWHTLDEDHFVEWARDRLTSNDLKPPEDEILKAIWRDSYSSMQEWLVKTWAEMPDVLKKAIVLSHASGILRGMYAEVE